MSKNTTKNRKHKNNAAERSAYLKTKNNDSFSFLETPLLGSFNVGALFDYKAISDSFVSGEMDNDFAKGILASATLLVCEGGESEEGANQGVEVEVDSLGKILFIGYWAHKHFDSLTHREKSIAFTTISWSKSLNPSERFDKVSSLLGQGSNGNFEQLGSLEEFRKATAFLGLLSEMNIED